MIMALTPSHPSVQSGHTPVAGQEWGEACGQAGATKHTLSIEEPSPPQTYFHTKIILKDLLILKANLNDSLCLCVCV